MNNDFFMTLVSNASMSIYPDNQPSHFRSRLPYTLELEGHWEVCLSELHYSIGWKTLRHRETIEFGCADGEISNIEIPGGYYEKISDLINLINTRIKFACHDREAPVRFATDQLRHQVHLHLHKSAFVKLGKGIRTLLGFSPVHKTSNESQENTFRESCSAPLPHLVYAKPLYFYLNLIEPQIVSDCGAPLLRIIDNSGSVGQLATRTFLKPHYFKVKDNFIACPEVQIRFNDGELVSFLEGSQPLVAVLHFRKAKR